MPLMDVCGIEGCDNNIPATPDGVTQPLTCNLPAHIAIHRAWQNCFGRANYHGVWRGIKKNAPWNPQPENDDEDSNVNPGHTFQARRSYCVQTVSWACGVPIGWGKCYEIESLTQVLALLNFWFPAGQPRPQFLAYDNACRLLAHIVTQNLHDAWLTTTRFIVNAWHYVNHHTTDIICQQRCNPTSLNGTQPDLVVTREGINGTSYSNRAFNTETAEQFNAWLDGFESQLRQMTDFNFGFYMHAVLLLSKEDFEAKIEKNDLWVYEDEEENENE